MALQTSGEITLNQISVEANSPYASGFQSSPDSTQIRLLVEATGKDINKTSGTEVKWSDFYGATKFDYTNVDAGAPRVEAADSTDFTMTEDDTTGGVAYAGTQIQVAVQSNGTTVNVKYKDLTNTGTTLGTYDATVDDTFSFTINPYYDTSISAVRNANHGLQWRWGITNLNLDFTAGHTDEQFVLGFFSGTTFYAQQTYYGTGGDQTNLSYTSSWRDFDPSPNATLNVKLYARANETATSGLSRTLATLSSGGSIRLEIRDDGRTQTASHLYIKKTYSSSSNPILDASSLDDGGGGS